jgi:hypothetical protein
MESVGLAIHKKDEQVSEQQQRLAEQAMQGGRMATEKREVCDFNRVRMQDFGWLHITQGHEESLVIEADEETLKKVYTEVRDGELILRVGRDFLERLGIGLQTSLTRPQISYRLTVKDLRGLAVAGWGRAEVGELSCDRLSVHLSGGGEISLQSVRGEYLEAKLSGAGRIATAGKVSEQDVALRGAGKYEGGQLETQKTHVAISGAGSATVWAVDSLDVSLSGVGSVEYYGDPKVRRSTSGLGSIQHLGSH